MVSQSIVIRFYSGSTIRDSLPTISLPVHVKSLASEHCRSFTRGPVLHFVAMDDVTAHRGSGAFGAESDRYKHILCH